MPSLLHRLSLRWRIRSRHGLFRHVRLVDGFISSLHTAAARVYGKFKPGAIAHAATTPNMRRDYDAFRNKFIRALVTQLSSNRPHLVPSLAGSLEEFGLLFDQLSSRDRWQPPEEAADEQKAGEDEGEGEGDCEGEGEPGMN